MNYYKHKQNACKQHPVDRHQLPIYFNEEKAKLK